MGVQEPMHRTLGSFSQDGIVKCEPSDLAWELSGESSTFPGSIATRMTRDTRRGMMEEFSPRHLRMWVVTKGDIFSLYAELSTKSLPASGKQFPLPIVGEDSSDIEGHMSTVFLPLWTKP